MRTVLQTDTKLRNEYFEIANTPKYTKTRAFNVMSQLEVLVFMRGRLPVVNNLSFLSCFR